MFINALAALALLVPPQDTARSANALRWVPNPTLTTHGWVSDPAHHLKAETVARIDSIAFALERASSVEMAVVVIDSLDGLTPDAAALLLHRRWGVGKRDRNNGIVLLWSPALRKVAVSVGYGLEGVLTDSRVGSIEDAVIIPRFKAGEFDTGITGGVAALAGVAKRDTATIRVPGLAYHPPPSVGATGDADATTGRSRVPAWLALLLVPLAAIGTGVASWRRYRPRRCPNGHGVMRRLAEEEDDAKLSKEEQLEESLHSVDYDVWLCSQCGAAEVLPYRKWFSSYSECTRCHRRTASSTTTTLIPSTQETSGVAKVETDCRNCGAHEEHEKVLPRLPSSSSSGSGGSSFSSGGGGGGGGGGSSFGGGSAGGGGASRSY